MKNLRPDMYKKSLKDINFVELKKMGIKVVLLDVDNTILRYKSNEIDEDIIKLINAIKTQFNVILFSNSINNKPKKIGKNNNISFIAPALKPIRKNFKKVLKEYKVTEEEVCIIGDQILTDIKGGNKVGIMTILIDPLSEKDGFFTGFNRRKEKRIMRKMGAAGLFFKGRYYE